jgi:hypothetical protein
LEIFRPGKYLPGRRFAGGWGLGPYALCEVYVHNVVDGKDWKYFSPVNIYRADDLQVAWGCFVGKEGMEVNFIKPQPGGVCPSIPKG